MSELEVNATNIRKLQQKIESTKKKYENAKTLRDTEKIKALSEKQKKLERELALIKRQVRRNNVAPEALPELRDLELERQLNQRELNDYQKELQKLEIEHQKEVNKLLDELKVVAEKSASGKKSAFSLFGRNKLLPERASEIRYQISQAGVKYWQKVNQLKRKTIADIQARKSKLERQRDNYASKHQDEFDANRDRAQKIELLNAEIENKYEKIESLRQEMSNWINGGFLDHVDFLVQSYQNDLKQVKERYKIQRDKLKEQYAELNEKLEQDPIFRILPEAQRSRYADLFDQTERSVIRARLIELEKKKESDLAAVKRDFESGADTSLKKRITHAVDQQNAAISQSKHLAKDQAATYYGIDASEIKLKEDFKSLVSQNHKDVADIVYNSLTHQDAVGSSRFQKLEKKLSTVSSDKIKLEKDVEKMKKKHTKVSRQEAETDITPRQVRLLNTQESLRHRGTDEMVNWYEKQGFKGSLLPFPSANERTTREKPPL